MIVSRAMAEPQTLAAIFDCVHCRHCASAQPAEWVASAKGTISLSLRLSLSLSLPPSLPASLVLSLGRGCCFCCDLGAEEVGAQARCCGLSSSLSAHSHRELQ